MRGKQPPTVVVRARAGAAFGTVFRYSGAVRWILGLMFVALLLPVGAEAQSAEERALARDEFQRGVAAAEERRWDEAVRAFERSQAISPRPPTLFNLAGALVNAGRLVEARERYREFAGQTEAGPLSDEAQRSIEALEDRLARLTIEVENLAPVDEVRLDEQALSHATLGAPLPADPGAHVVVVMRGQTELVREEVTVEEGGARSVSLRVPAPAAASGSSDTVAVGLTEVEEEDDDEDGGADLAWLGVLIGVVVAGGIAAGVTTWAVMENETPVFNGTAGMFVLP